MNLAVNSYSHSRKSLWNLFTLPRSPQGRLHAALLGAFPSWVAFLPLHSDLRSAQLVAFTPDCFDDELLYSNRMARERNASEC